MPGTLMVNNGRQLLTFDCETGFLVRAVPLVHNHPLPRLEDNPALFAKIRASRTTVCKSPYKTPAIAPKPLPENVLPVSRNR